MTPEQLASIVSQAKCRVFGWEDAGNNSHRSVLGTIIQSVNQEAATIYCEPSLTRSTTRPPDVVIVCPISGVVVIEVKGVGLSDIEGIDPGGQFVIQYSSGARSRNPFAQVRNAMFDIKNAAERAYARQFSMPFHYFVTLPKIERSQWKDRWGQDAILPQELVFGKQLQNLVAAIVKLGQKRLEAIGRTHWPKAEFEAVQRGAFGDTSVLFPLPDERKPRRVQEATLGEMFDDSAESYKSLSDEQQKLSAQYWSRGPRLIRGVAGSGKTIVLANNLARRVQRMLNEGNTLFDDAPQKPRFLVVCFNRTLVPFIKKKLDVAYRQRTGASLPEGIVDVYAFNRLMWHKAENGLWRYQKVFEQGANNETRVAQYLYDLNHARDQEPHNFDQHAYDAIYVDEGQDFHEEEFRLLAGLCQRGAAEPNLFVFYDDAQNLYGRKRPNWHSLGLNVVGGRSFVMTECFRNTRQILEMAFNVLYGSFATDRAKVPTKAFGDIATLVDKDLLQRVNDCWNVLFAKRSGASPVVKQFTNEEAENEYVLARLKWLIQEQDVRPQDILILSMKKKRIEKLAAYVADTDLGVDLHLAFKAKDEILGQRKCLTFSTVASAKGYDAYCVFLVSANEFKPDIDGRASFYVGCTRAIEYLEVTGYSDAGLMSEAARAVEALAVD